MSYHLYRTFPSFLYDLLFWYRVATVDLSSFIVYVVCPQSEAPLVSMFDAATPPSTSGGPPGGGTLATQRSARSSARYESIHALW